MKDNIISLNKLKIGQKAVVHEINIKDLKRKKHLQEMGLVPGTKIKIKKVAPMGDPICIELRGYELCVSKKELEAITFKKTDFSLPINTKCCYCDNLCKKSLISMKKRINNRLCVLVGNQNCGKTTLFNLLTGMNQKVGNWPGVTIEKKEGIIKGTDYKLIDLPGIYSLNPYTEEEKISSEYIFSGNADIIINVIDATCLERSLYLTMQLLELNYNVIIALNMIRLT